MTNPSDSVENVVSIGFVSGFVVYTEYTKYTTMWPITVNLEIYLHSLPHAVEDSLLDSFNWIALALCKFGTLTLKIKKETFVLLTGTKR